MRTVHALFSKNVACNHRLEKQLLIL
jgi:hypothetical protein